MTKEDIQIHKGKAQNPLTSVWWRPFFSTQKEINRTLRNTFNSIGGSSFWDTEEQTFSEIQQNMNRVFSEMFNNRQMLTPWILGNPTEPYVDIVENGKEFKLKAELPGVDQKDLDISTVDGSLVIQGTKCEEKMDEGDKYIHRECCCGSFNRTIALPEEADVEKAEARFKDNILTVEIPKKTQTKPKAKKVEVKSNGNGNDNESANSSGSKKAA